MRKIQLLDSKTINKIAAGEVVESPRSVVKELAENAMDAGASAITVEIREGGISYIRVTDNGCGIPKEQVKTAFLRHATSKLSEIEDLERIFTLGFRGEALASIAAVAQVEMLTKTHDEATGTRICISGGEIEVMEDFACREGTSVTVRNLFYNVPARRKFLKKPATESSHVSDLVNKLALGHPEVAMQYINNDTTILHTAGNHDLKAAVFYVYGKEAAGNMLPISFQSGEYAVSGLIGKPSLARANRNYENLFINGRYIKNSVISAAVEDAYKTKLLIGKFPVFVLNLEVEPALVDANVHPAKLEVRFRDEDAVYELFYTAVDQALREATLIPQVSMEKKPKEKPPLAEQQSLAAMASEQKPTEQKPTEQKPTEPAPHLPERKEGGLQSESVRLPMEELLRLNGGAEKKGGRSVDELLGRKKPYSGISQPRMPFPMEPEKAAEKPAPQETPKQPEKQEKKPFFREYRIIGQIFRTYWIVEQEDSLYLIDQHAAHERILYEELMQKFRAEQVISQRLLTPLMLQLTPSEMETLQENKALLEAFGFALEQFGDRYALRAVPYLLQQPNGIGFFTEILDRLAEERIRNIYDTKLLAVATMACKAAVKGHDSLSIREAEELIRRLLQLEHPFTCPHGRPTIVALTKYELEKMFQRVQN